MNDIFYFVLFYPDYIKMVPFSPLQGALILKSRKSKIYIFLALFWKAFIHCDSCHICFLTAVLYSILLDKKFFVFSSIPLLDYNGYVVFDIVYKLQISLFQVAICEGIFKVC